MSISIVVLFIISNASLWDKSILFSSVKFAILISNIILILIVLILVIAFFFVLLNLLIKIIGIYKLVFVLSYVWLLMKFMVDSEINVLTFHVIIISSFFSYLIVILSKKNSQNNILENILFLRIKIIDNRYIIMVPLCSFLFMFLFRVNLLELVINVNSDICTTTFIRFSMLGPSVIIFNIVHNSIKNIFIFNDGIFINFMLQVLNKSNYVVINNSVSPILYFFYYYAYIITDPWCNWIYELYL